MKNFVFLCALVNHFLFSFLLKFAFHMKKNGENHMALARLSGFSVPCVPGFVTFVF